MTACLKRGWEARINKMYISHCGQKLNAHCIERVRDRTEAIKRSVRVGIGTKSKSGASCVITFLFRHVAVINCHQHLS